jgi:hypothetical protein
MKLSSLFLAALSIGASLFAGRNQGAGGQSSGRQTAT